MSYTIRIGIIKYLIVLTVLLSVSSCSAIKGMMTGAELLAPAKNGIEADLTIGKREDNLKVEVGSQVTRSEQQAKEIVNNIDNVPFVFMLLLVLGWLLPSPNEMWKGLRGMVLFWKKKQ